MMRNPGAQRCRKQGYTSRTRLEKIRARRERQGNVDLSVYYHPECGMWHLTSKGRTHA